MSLVGIDALPPPPPVPTVGRKNDAGKRPWDLVPFGAMGVVVDVLAFGAALYGAHNWRYVADPERRYFSAAMRHLVAWQEGERLDPESGLPHLAHAACCVLFLLSTETERAAGRESNPQRASSGRQP